MSKGGGAGSRPGGSAKASGADDAPSRASTRAAAEAGPRPVFVACADEAAHAALLRRAQPGTVVRCDVCDVVVEGEPGGRGLFLWSRGEELRWDEPALCEACAAAVTMSAVRGWDIEDEEG